ncbi:MAG TPA: ATP-binding protein, partial [Gemmataceae bacterium]|nr:ATP-binding protein [Gemmataceae bacterium]
MRFIIAQEFYQQMLQVQFHTPDCYVRPGQFLHHMYIDGVKYVIAPAVLNCLAQAEEQGDQEAIEHLRLHKLHYEQLLADAQRIGDLEGVTLLGDPPPTDEEAVPVTGSHYAPRVPTRWEDLGLDLPFLFDLILRMIYSRGQSTGG